MLKPEGAWFPITVLLAFWSSLTAGRRLVAGSEAGGDCLQASQLVAITNSLRAAHDAGDSYDAVAKLAFDKLSGAQHLTAFEENRSFAYAAGTSGSGVLRRLIILKPDIFI